MRRVVFNGEDYFPYIEKVTYTLRTRTKTGIGIDITIHGNTSQIYFWGSWRRFKRYIA